MLAINQVVQTPELSHIAKSQAFKDQFSEIQSRRSIFNSMQKGFAQQVSEAMAVNQAARIPQDVFREFDEQATRIMRANNLVLMNDLMGLARAMPIGKTLYEYRQSSDANITTTSINGQDPANLDKTAYTYAGAIVPIRSTGYSRGWREWAAQQSENFDGLIDDNANAVREIMDSTAAYFYDGDPNITYKGQQAYGIKTSSATELVDLGVGGENIDFTTSTDSEAIRRAMTNIVYRLRIDNNVMDDITIYISREIERNFQRPFDTTGGLAGQSILNFLKQNLIGVADIKTDAELTGNELVGIAMQEKYIQPLLGMALSTVPMVRNNPFDNYNFLVWNASGLVIREDAEGRSGVVYAREA